MAAFLIFITTGCSKTDGLLNHSRQPTFNEFQKRLQLLNTNMLLDEVLDILDVPKRKCYEVLGSPILQPACRIDFDTFSCILYFEASNSSSEAFFSSYKCFENN